MNFFFNIDEKVKVRKNIWYRPVFEIFANKKLILISKTTYS